MVTRVAAREREPALISKSGRPWEFVGVVGVEHAIPRNRRRLRTKVSEL